MLRNLVRAGASLAVAAALTAFSWAEIHVQPSDPNIRYIGRWSKAAPDQPRCAWSATGIALRFEGTSLTLLLKDSASGTPNKVKGVNGNYFSVVVDRTKPSALELLPGQTEYAVAKDLKPGKHTVTIAKRTEAGTGPVTFLGVVLEDGAKLLAPPKAPRRRVEFIGDSITCGYGIEGANEKENYCSATEDATAAYGYLTAQLLGAEYSGISASGWGAYRAYGGEFDAVLGRVWDRTLIDEASSTWDFKRWQPDAVVINLGTNDFAKGVPDEKLFVGAYTALVNRILAAYPKAHLFCTVGPMVSDSWPKDAKHLTTLRRYVKTVVDAHPDRLHFVGFPGPKAGEGYGSDWHPSAKTQRRMATQLAKEIRLVLGY